MKMFFPAVVIFFISLSASAQDKFSLGTGVDYSSGKYGGTTSIDIIYIPVTAKYEAENSFYKLTVPYISVTGTGTSSVIRGLGRSGLVMNSTSTTTNSGLGDVVASAGYNAYDSELFALDLVGNIKFGTADANKGLGTGYNDYSAQLDAYYILDKTTLFATAGYKIYGSPPGLSLSNAVYGTFGASRKLNNKTSIGAMYDQTQSPIVYGAGQSEFTVYLSEKIKPDLKVQVNVMKGFSSASPDYGGGVMITGYF